MTMTELKDNRAEAEAVGDSILGIFEHMVLEKHASPLVLMNAAGIVFQRMFKVLYDCADPASQSKMRDYLMKMSFQYQDTKGVQ